jgi:PIN domain nuclease of toxin-antitoxin system
LRFLLDTHLLLWALAEPEKLPIKAMMLLEAPEHQGLSSTVAIWEIAIKFARNRGGTGDMPISGQQALALAQAANIDLIDITPNHAAAVDRLPLLHPDPFDRLLVAQAAEEQMTLLTVDRKLAAYGDFVMVL